MHTAGVIMSTASNPGFNPTGIEGGVDTHSVPWLTLPQAPGLFLKPLRASNESGMFTVIARMGSGTQLAPLVHLGAMDLLVLSGAMTYPAGPLAGTLDAGVWGYVPANTRSAGLYANEDVEFLLNCYGPIAFLADDERTVSSILTSMDIIIAAHAHGVTLVPNTLAECMQPRASSRDAPDAALAIADPARRILLTLAAAAAGNVSRAVHPHFIDTRQVPWAVNPKTPDFGMKVLRVSEETGVTSLIVRHNGVAGPHYHLGASDFLILNGRIVYRAGPPEGYGAGVWFYEPAGARHEATQRLGTDDLIYTANVYGPLQFDHGRGTPISAVLSWVQYKKMAEASGTRLVRNTFADDRSLLAWAPLC
jgi:quercetin dioxygenase-like cupin family protein